MIRKSKAQRIADVRSAIPRWHAAGRDRETRFMEDMVARLERGQGLSPRQRTWLDELSSTEPPAPTAKELPLIARCQAAMEHLGNRDASIVRDFVGRLHRGWQLSDKQVAFLESLLQKAEGIAKDGPWQPRPEQIAEGVFAAQVVATRSSSWKGTHLGILEASHRILSSQGVEYHYTAASLEPADEWCYQKVIESMGPAVREFRKPKFQEGEMVEVPWWPGAGARASRSGSPGVITSGPVAFGGDVGYEVFAHGQVTVFGSKHLKRMK
jgi:hypothetical protein